jgi:hypothetical protein
MNVTMRVMDDSGRQKGARADAPPREAWERLGALLAERRGQLDPRYRHRNVFATEVGLKESLLADVENAKRETFTPPTLAAIEVAYRIAPGSIRQVLDDPSLTEFPHRLGGAVLAVSSGDSATVAESETVTQREPLRNPGDLGDDIPFSSLKPWEQRLLMITELSPEQRIKILTIARWELREMPAGNPMPADRPTSLADRRQNGPS